MPVVNVLLHADELIKLIINSPCYSENALCCSLFEWIMIIAIFTTFQIFVRCTQLQQLSAHNFPLFHSWVDVLPSTLQFHSQDFSWRSINYEFNLQPHSKAQGIIRIWNYFLFIDKRESNYLKGNFPPVSVDNSESTNWTIFSSDLWSDCDQATILTDMSLISNILRQSRS